MRRISLILASLAALLVGVGAVTLAAPGVEECAAQGASAPDLEARISCAGSPGGPAGVPGGGSQGACKVSTGLRSTAVRRSGRGVRFAFTRRGAGRVTVEVFRVSQSGRVVAATRVARFTDRPASFTWSGRGRRVGDGIYLVRYVARGAETRRFALRRSRGRFSVRPAFQRADACGAIRTFKLERPAFGGRTLRPLGISYRLNRPARVTVTLLRGTRAVRRLRAAQDGAGRTVRLRLPARGLRRGDYRVRLSVRPTSGAPATVQLTSARL